MSLLKKFGLSKPHHDPKRQAEVYTKLREMVLTKEPRMVPAVAVWAVLMDIALPNGTATMVAVADGTVSLYTSTGGGSIGLGSHEGPRKAAASLLDFASGFLTQFEPTSHYPLPSHGKIKFFLRSGAVTVTAEAPQTELASGTHQLSALYGKCQELLTEIRLIDTKYRQKLPSSPPTVQ